jgi:Na+-driven multidrug efflux pump
MRQNKERKTTILTLGIPIFIQLMLFNLLSTVDTLMISEYNEAFIISMNNASSIIHLLNVLLSICSTGVGIVIAQYLGAKKNLDAKIAFNNGLLFNLFLSIVLFLVLFILNLF